MTTNKNYANFDWNKVKTVDDIKSFLKAIHPRVQVDKNSKEYDILSHLCDDKDYEVGTLEQAEEFAKKRCYCYNCATPMKRMTTFIVCPECGNKRCPHATDHSLECTNSNEPGQKGSRFE